MTENEIGTILVDQAVKLHQELGPGLLESVYEVILAKMLTDRGLEVQRQKKIPIVFHGEQFDQGFRADLVINDRVLVELKSVEVINPVYKKQLLTYMKLTDIKLGYLLNFGETLMKNGVYRVISGRLD